MRVFFLALPLPPPPLPPPPSSSSSSTEEAVVVMSTGSVASMVARLGDWRWVRNRCDAGDSPSPRSRWWWSEALGSGRTIMRRRSLTRPCLSNRVSKRDTGRSDFTFLTGQRAEDGGGGEREREDGRDICAKWRSYKYRRII